MGVIEFYIIFALTTGAVSLYELVGPVMFELSLHDPKHNMVEYKYLSYFVFFVFCTAVAPLMFLSCIVPSFGERFKGALVTALTAKP